MATNPGKPVGVTSINSVQPKTDSFQAVWVRRVITLSYWTVILLCLPYWWHSTTIERHALPLDEIAAWQNGGPCPAHVPVQLHIIPPSSGSAIREEDVISGLNAFSAKGRRCVAFQKATSNISTSAYSVRVKDQGSAEANLLDHASAEVVATSSQITTTRLASLFMPSLSQTEAGRNTRFSQNDKAVKYAQKYKLVFSLLNENMGDGGIAQWEATEALESYVYPLLRSLDALHSYDVETQVQYYSPLSIEREFTAEGVVIEEEQMKIFVDSATWNLASAVSSDPTLHFIVYVPAQNKQPLLLRRVDGSVEPLSFFSLPQWGGITIQTHTSSDINEAATSAGVLSREDLRSAFTIFAGQLEAFHGLSSMAGVMGVDAIKMGWKVQALMRERVVENVLDATQKLGALSRQVHEIQNMRIPRAVQDDVQGALKALNLVATDDLKEAMRQSTQAASLATRASFNHEMLAMLYFPDEHKWAVYTPLFGPVAVPLLVALLREIKEYKRRRREKQKKE